MKNKLTGLTLQQAELLHHSLLYFKNNFEGELNEDELMDIGYLVNQLDQIIKYFKSGEFEKDRKEDEWESESE